MTNDKEKLLKELQNLIKDAKTPECPTFFNDERLQDAFKEPVTDPEGYCDPIPAIWNDYGYGKDADGVLFISSKSATIESRLYSKYLDCEALVWDSAKQRLLYYAPDPENPKVAFKGSLWQFAKRLKPEYEDCISLRDIYLSCSIMKA